MDCPRCHGLMMTIRMKEAGSGDTASGWRCLLCGEAIDPGIEANRKAHVEPIRCRARPPGTALAGSGKSTAGRGKCGFTPMAKESILSRSRPRKNR